MMEDFQRIFVLAPHADDGDFGCGGTIARFAEEGKEIHYAVFSICEQSVPPGFPQDILATEVKEATACLGIDEANLLFHNFSVRHFPQHRQDILEELVAIRDSINPDLVLIPCSSDIHQDHMVMFQEGVRAFKQTCVLGYEMPWNTLQFSAMAFVHLEERHVKKKIEAIGQYKSQSQKDYADKEFIKGLARTRGIQAGTRFAEAFEVIRWIIR